MRVCQLTKYNTRNIFIEKSYTISGGNANPGPFYKKSKLSISLDLQAKTLYLLITKKKKKITSFSANPFISG